MSTIPQHLSPRDGLLFSLAKLNGHIMYAQTEAARMGMPGLEEDLSQIWRELMRIEADFAGMAYARSSRRGAGAPTASPSA